MGEVASKTALTVEPGSYFAGVLTATTCRMLERVSRYVEAHPGCELEDVQVALPLVPGLASEMLRQLVRAGFVDDRQGYRSFKPYRRLVCVADVAESSVVTGA